MLREMLASPHVTEVCRLDGRVGLMAFHGGNLERATDVVASEVATRTGSSFYAVLQSAPLRKHLPSTAFRPDHSDALAGFLDHVEVAVAIHGYRRLTSRWRLLLGGQNRALAEHLASHLRVGLPSEYEVVSNLDEMPRSLRGQHPDNPVNLPPERGVQIELPPTIRWNRSGQNWSDYHGTGRAEQVDQLIGALASGVSTWSVRGPVVTRRTGSGDRAAICPARPA